MCCFLLCFIELFRTTRPAETDTDVIYPREDQRARRSHQNFGFIDPPPRYEQIFKRDGGPPTVVTTRESPSVTMSSGEPSLPPSYEQAEIHARRTSHVTLPQSTFREVPISSIDMEHPVMAPPSADVLDMASEIANIQNHAFACVHRYDSRHADEIQRTAAAVSSTDSSSNALPELEAPEGGPPGYDAISLASEAISAR